MSIFYHIGDVTAPIYTDTPRIVAHCCNDCGRWGAGVSGAIGRCWPKAEKYYRFWHRGMFSPDEFLPLRPGPGAARQHRRPLAD